MSELRERWIAEKRGRSEGEKKKKVSLLLVVRSSVDLGSPAQCSVLLTTCRC